MDKSGYAEIWGAGKEESLKELFFQIIEKMRKAYGHEKVSLWNQNARVSWKDATLYVDLQPNKVRIHINSEHENFKPIIWNKILADFNKEIVEPIKDNLEGVQTAIGFPPQKIN
jgi:hypothetical protein